MILSSLEASRLQSFEPSLDAYLLGPLSYREGLALQHQMHSEVLQKKRFGAVLMLEHKPVITLGKNANAGLILRDEKSLQEAGIDLILTDRGGEVTAHEPGQLVVYPILPLQELKLPAKLYVDRLLRSVILTLNEYSIASEAHPDYPGVWVGNDKICAIGIRVKERVSLHGIALNISNSLDLFQMIVPCGIRGRGVTSMQKLLSSAPDLSDVARVWLEKFSEVMDLPVKFDRTGCILT